MTPTDPPPALWDAAPWDDPAPSSNWAATSSRPINRLLKGAWLSPPFEPSVRDALVAAGVLNPAPDPEPMDLNQWSTPQ